MKDLFVSKILLYFMSCRQTENETEKDIGELNQSVGEPTTRNVGDWKLTRKFQRNEGKTAQLHYDLPSHNNNYQNRINTTSILLCNVM